MPAMESVGLKARTVVNTHVGALSVCFTLPHNVCTLFTALRAVVGNRAGYGTQYSSTYV